MKGIFVVFGDEMGVSVVFLGCFFAVKNSVEKS
jgi:hypothetical protein